MSFAVIALNMFFPNGKTKKNELKLSLAELKVQLEVSEGETGLLRKKVENLLTDNLKLTKEIKEANKTKAKPGYASSRSSDPDARLHDVQEELNSTRFVCSPPAWVVVR